MRPIKAHKVKCGNSEYLVADEPLTMDEYCEWVTSYWASLTDEEREKANRESWLEHATGDRFSLDV